MSGWQQGDRVCVFLLDDRLPRRRERWFSGTVREVDPPGLPPGVRVDLDELVNGVWDCFATHAELRADPGPLGLRQPYDPNGHEITEMGWEHEC